MKRVFPIVFLLAILGIGFAVWHEGSRSQVGLQALMEVSGDVQQDVMRVGNRMIKISDADEMQIGRRMARQFHGSTSNASIASYVSSVGHELLGARRRKGISYTFHVIDSKTVNAFAMPGGQVFVFSGLLDFVESEAELAFILGHEISHIDMRHCVDMFQIETHARNMSAIFLPGPLPQALAGLAARFATRIVSQGYQQNQEFEADAHGLNLMINAGYYPRAALAVNARLGDRFGEKYADKKRKAKTPVGEIFGGLQAGVDSYFLSHPPTDERKRRLKKTISRHTRGLKEKKWYVGEKNLKRKVCRSQKAFLDEQIVWE